MLCVKDVIPKFTAPGQIVVGPCPGTISNVKTCMLQARQRRFVECQVGTMCFNKSLLSVVEVFAWSFIKDNSNIVEGPDFQAVAKVLASVLKGINIESNRALWDRVRCLCSIYLSGPHHPFPLEQTRRSVTE